MVELFFLDIKLLIISSTCNMMMIGLQLYGRHSNKNKHGLFFHEDLIGGCKNKVLKQGLTLKFRAGILLSSLYEKARKVVQSLKQVTSLVDRLD
jgi:hypothetical protein